jgi:hypothetical protein
MLPLVFPLLKNAPAVTALIGASPVRAYRHGNAPQDVVRPYVTWSVPGGAAENTFDGADADFFRVQVDCWSDDDTQIEALAAAVRAALEPAAHLVAYLADDRDETTKRYRMSFAFDFILSRN